MRASRPTDGLHCLLPIIKKLCRERLIPVQEPNQRSGWPLKSGCGRSDLPYIFRITLPAKNLSPFYPIRPEKYVDKPRFIWYIIQAIFCGHGPLVKRLRQRPLTPLTWVRFPHGSPKNTPAYAGVFFRVSRAGIEQGSAPQRTKNSPVDCFLARGRFPRVSPKNTPAYAGVFFRVSRARNRTRRCAGAFVRDNGTLYFWLYP